MHFHYLLDTVHHESRSEPILWMKEKKCTCYHIRGSILVRNSGDYDRKVMYGGQVTRREMYT